MADTNIDRLAEQATQAIHNAAIYEAADVATVWEATKAVDSKQMTLVIAEVTRVTARKIKDGILALVHKPPAAKNAPEYVQVACDCDAGGKSCPQGKLDYGHCTIWLRNH